MKKLTSQISSLTIFLSIYSALFIAAIPVLCVSAGNSIAWMVISIVILGTGLPLLSVFWCRFGLLVSLRRITTLIEQESVYSVEELSSRLRISKRAVARRIRRVLRYHILRDYFFDGALVHPTYRIG